MSNDGSSGIERWIKSKFRPSELFFSTKSIYIDPDNKKFRKFKPSKYIVLSLMMYCAYQGFWLFCTNLVTLRINTMAQRLFSLGHI